ncbi:MAG: long-chain fatty acid--CoA ligase [Deltaproteobacteria bacterium]|nr:long-chain fatty acid--CoA ligase [Deltaproteobacteria bacterium]
MGVPSGTAALDRLSERVLDFIDRHAEATLDDGPGDGGAEFDALALEAFRFQYEHSPTYRAFCERRGRGPDRVRGWREIPAVPTTAFKSLDLACAPPQKTFLTSGTTQGRETRGRHHVPRLELYRRSALAHFRRMVLTDGMQPRIVGFLGGPEILPDSSLVQMVEWLRCDLGGEPAYLVDEDGFDAGRAAERLEALAGEGRPLCLIGVRVVFTSFLEHCRREGRAFSLPPDSRVVDTGGPKGGRALSDAGFLTASWHTLGVAGYYCVNEYGMTELCSQYYDDVLAERFAGTNRKRRKAGPAWLRARAVDPTTLEPVPDGEPGILCHVDLANALSVVAVQTEDVGVMEGRRFRLLGRAAGAEPRGCALALADLLAGRP